MKATLGLMAWAALAIAGPATAQVTALSGSVGGGADVALAGETITGTTNVSSGWVGVPADVSQSIYAEAFNPATGGKIVASGETAATWASALAGTVSFDDFGWSFQTPDPLDAGQYAGLTSAPNWVYTFTADQNATFTLNYDVTGSGDTFGLWGWSLFDGGSLLLNLGNPVDPTASGSYAFALVAGQSYALQLWNNANISNPANFADYSGSMDGRFAWSISTAAVPEPTTWALMIGGFGVVGGALRRRRELVRA